MNQSHFNVLLLSALKLLASNRSTLPSTSSLLQPYFHTVFRRLQLLEFALVASQVSAVIPDVHLFGIFDLRMCLSPTFKLYSIYVTLDRNVTIVPFIALLSDFSLIPLTCSAVFAP